MRTYLIRSVLALVVMLAVGATASAQSVVRGTVLGPDGKPVEGVTVTIAAKGSTQKSEVKTNRNGEFVKVGLVSGAYIFTAAKDGLIDVVESKVSQGPLTLSFKLAAGGGVALPPGMSAEEFKKQQEMQALVQTATDMVNAGRVDEAIPQLTDIVTKMPQCGECFYYLGMAHTKKGQMAEAEAAFLKATVINPTGPDAYTALASVYNSQKKFDQAAQASAKASELAGATGGNPAATAETAYNQGVIMWNAGKYAEAKEQFETAAKANPGMAMAHYQLGMANLNLGQIPQARAAFEGYLKADPNGPKAAEVQGFLKQLPQ